jgi:hypothetical protein
MSAILQTVLETLSENGHNIRDLKPQERITISLSYSKEISTPSKTESNTEEKKPDKPQSDSRPANPANPEKNESAIKNPHYPLSEADRNALANWIAGNNQPQTEIDRMTIRRIYLDAFGRPPTADEMKGWSEHIPHESYDALVQRLIGSEQGKQARDVWHDAIRFSHRIERMPVRSRISVSATKEQLDKVSSGELTTLDLMRLAQIRVYESK